MKYLKKRKHTGQLQGEREIFQIEGDHIKKTLPCNLLYIEQHIAFFFAVPVGVVNFIRNNIHLK